MTVSWVCYMTVSQYFHLPASSYVTTREPQNEFSRNLALEEFFLKQSSQFRFYLDKTKNTGHLHDDSTEF